MIAATAPLPTQQHRQAAADGGTPWLHARPGTLYDGTVRGPWDTDRGGIVRAGADQQKMAFRTNRSMTANDAPPAAQGIEAVLLANRERIIRFLEVRGAGTAAEDMFQDLWMRLTDRRTGPIAEPLSYVMRAANNLMLDRYRSTRQSALRDKAWSEHALSEGPSAEAVLISREQLAQVEAAIAATGERPARIFRRFRVDGIAQRDIAAEQGVSLSTVEADLRKVYAALAVVRRQFDAP